ncbi:MAG: ABC transporter substrate-binding protein [Chloroflexi bacterium]|nr:ABC transporter substrate-binding protein [Chloroflexota bacterium]
MACGGESEEEVDTGPAAAEASPTSVPPSPAPPTQTPRPVTSPTPEPPSPTQTPRPVPSPTPEPSPTPALFPFVVVDSNGNEVVFEEPPERIVAFDSAAVEILFDIGEGDRVVATHSFVSYPPEVADIPKVGDAFNMNVEAIVAVEPDLVFVFFDRFVEDLEKAGLKVFYLETLSDDFKKTADNIRMWGRITGNVSGAAASAERFESRVARIEQTIESVDGGLRVFQDVGGFWSPGPDTLVGGVFDLLKLENIAHDISGYAQISPEAIVARDPQIVITPDPESFAGNEAFKDVSAVREGRVFSLPSDTLSVAGPRFVQGIEELARLAYPELFGAYGGGDETDPVEKSPVVSRTVAADAWRDAA